jgi:acyl-[acyl-carrier-protein] desaturase
VLQIMDAVYEKDPNGATLAFADMMKKQIVMPAHLMDDGEHHGKTGRNLFAVSCAAAVSKHAKSRPQLCCDAVQ